MSDNKKITKVFNRVCKATTVWALFTTAVFQGVHLYKDVTTQDQGVPSSKIAGWKKANAADPEVVYIRNQWHAMQARQADLARTPAAAAYKKYLAKIKSQLAPIENNSDLTYEQKMENMATVVATMANSDITYTSDKVQYHKDDYWASPIETAKSKKGDCEDYAILEYALLRDLGVPVSHMSIVFVNAEGKRDSLDHVELVVNISPDNMPAKKLVLSVSEQKDGYSTPVLPQGRYGSTYFFQIDQHNDVNQPVVAQKQKPPPAGPKTG